MKSNFLYISIILLVLSAGCKNETTGQTTVVSPEQAYEILNKDHNIQLVDVRTTEEYGVSHLKNAQNICVTTDDFEEKVKTLDKNKPVYVYCRSGGRSAKAAAILEELGFTEIYDLQGGITKWEENGLETTN